MKKYLALVSLSVLLLGGISIASAQDASTTATSTPSTATTTTSTSTSPTPTPAPTPVPAPVPLPPVIQPGAMKLEIGSRGRVVIRGNVDSVGADYVMVKSWGGLWKVKVATGTEIIPRVTGTMSDLAKFSVGDYVGAEGSISTTENWTINAKTLRDRVARKVMSEERHDNQKEFRDMRKEDKKDEHKEEGKGDKKINEGKVSALSGTSFTVQNGPHTINVTTSAATKFVNRNWNTITLADILVGDSIRAYGSVSSSTLTAEVVRDTSIPR